jgi:hypothetical protein
VNISGLSEQLVAWFKNQGADLLHAGKSEVKLSQFKAGEQYLGKVLDTLPNGRSLVQVGQTTLDMALPKEIRIGESVRLVYMTAGPRPTFQLAQTPVAPTQPVRLSDTAQQVNALVRYAQTAQPTNAVADSAVPSGKTATQSPAGAPSTVNAAEIASAAPSLASGGARPIVSNVAVFFAAASAPPTTSAMTGGSANPTMMLLGQAVDGSRAALPSHASLMTQGIVTEDSQYNYVLPMRLRQILSESGMFYESHLGRWTEGRMNLESIQREPQARLLDNPGQVLKQPDLDGMPEEAARIAGRQLQMLEGGSFFWQGYAWPDQWLDWRVDENDSGGATDPEAAQWQTQLQLNLPRLGDVAAEMAIGPLGLRIKLKAGREQTLEEIKAAMPDLLDRLRLAELNPRGVEIGLIDGQS